MCVSVCACLFEMSVVSVCVFVTHIQSRLTWSLLIPVLPLALPDSL